MDSKELWQRFCNTGRVDHYLEYVQKAGCYDGTDKDKGTDTQGTQSQ